MFRAKSGHYRQRITIEEPVRGKNSAGDGVTTWQTVSLDSDTPLENIPARVLMGPGREKYAANAKQDSIDARVMFRWFEGLTQQMRIRWDGRIYAISGIEADETGRIEWRCQCTAGMTEGE